MQSNDQDKIWADYYARKRMQRQVEAVGLWEQLCAAGVNDKTVLALDFVHFGNLQASCRLNTIFTLLF